MVFSLFRFDGRGGHWQFRFAEWWFDEFGIGLFYDVGEVIDIGWGFGLIDVAEYVCDMGYDIGISE